MSDPIIKERIRAVLAERVITADNDGAFRVEADLLEFSNNSVQRALGSMIEDRDVSRHRSDMANRETGERPVTWKLVEVPALV